MSYFQRIVSAAIERRATDLFLVADYSPAVRIFEEVEFLQSPEISAAEIAAMIKEILPPDDYLVYQCDKHFSLSLGAEGSKVLFINISHRQTESIIVSIIDQTIYSLAQLNVPQDLQKVIFSATGLFIITGIGDKTPTVIALINEINEKHKKHILVTDDKMLRKRSNKSLISYCATLDRNRIKGFAADVIFMGDICNKQTYKLAIDLAQTGHLVIVTIDAISACCAIEKIINFFHDRNFAISTLNRHLLAIMTQVRVKKGNSLEHLFLYDFVECNDEIRQVINDSKTHRLDNSRLIAKILNLMNNGQLEYKIAKTALGKLGYLSEDLTGDVF